MRKIKLLLLSLLSLFAIQKISGQAKIEGIGIFKIDKTNIKIIDSLVKSGYNKKTCNDIYSCSKYNVSGMNIYEMINDTIKPDMTLPLIKENRAFVIGEYNVAGIKIKNLELNFYNDILFEIKCTNDLELQTPLKDKYNGVLKVDKKEITCRSIYGEFKEEEAVYTTTYRDDEKIKAFSVLSIYYDDKCKKNSLSYTLITNTKTEEIVNSKNSEVSKKIREKRNLEKKAQLDKL